MNGARGYNARLESVRGIAALTVAAFHTGQLRVVPENSTPQLAFGMDYGDPVLDFLAAAYRWFLNGNGAVVLFFVLSGYVLRLSLDRTQEPLGRLAAAFLGRRLLRLWPPIVLMVAIFAGVHYATGADLPGSRNGGYTLRYLLEHAALFKNRINGVVWTLQVEVFAAPVILALWIAVRRWGPGVLWAAVVIFYIVGMAGWISEPVSDALWIPSTVPTYLYPFVAGMLVKEWSRIASRLGVTRLGGFYPGLSALLIMAAPLIAPGFRYMLLLEVLGSVGLITGLSMGLGGRLNRFLDYGVVRFYGRISYSFYLLHPLLFLILWFHRPYLDEMLGAGLPPLLIAFILFVATTALITPLAWLSYRLVEVPSVALGRRVFARRDAPPDPAAFQTPKLNTAAG